jgi:RND family efflux transporter MFP subunit
MFLIYRGFDVQLKNKALLVVIVVILALAGIAWVARHPKSAPDDSAETSPAQGARLAVPVAVASEAPISSQLLISAEFRPFQEVDVHAKVSGYVKAISVDVGDHVKDNQTLAVLEIPEIDAEFKEAEASIRRARAEVRRLESEIQRAESAHSAAHSNATRLQDVIKTQPNLVAQQEVDDVVAKDKMSEANAESYRAGLSAAQEQLSVSEANAERIASMKAYARIVAPFAGVVTKRYADTGSLIQAGTASNTQAMPLVRIAENQKLRLVIPVPESASALIKLHSSVEVRVPALNRSFSGEVSRFADTVDKQTRTMETEVDVPNSSGVLIPGMFASAVLVTQQKEHAVTLPVQAVSRSGNQATALVVGPDSKLEQRSLVLGIESADRIEVISGVRIGDKVVVGSQAQLQPGQQVQPRVINVKPSDARE